jgi:hypothetical protein
MSVACTTIVDLRRTTSLGYIDIQVHPKIKSHLQEAEQKDNFS